APLSQIAVASARIHGAVTTVAASGTVAAMRPPWRHPMPSSLRPALFLFALFLAGQAVAGAEEDQRARNASRVLSEIQNIPEQAIPDKLLDEGRAIIVIPDTIKAGLVLGGRHGRGMMSVKNPDGAWSNPVLISLTGASIGFQADRKSGVEGKG